MLHDGLDSITWVNMFAGFVCQPAQCACILFDVVRGHILHDAAHAHMHMLTLLML